MSDTSLSPAPPVTSAPPVSHASPAGGHDLQRVRQRFLVVYAILVLGTALTVAMYYVHFDAVWQTVTVALGIAAFKGACVAAIFMHLWHGERHVHRILFFTGVFAAGMLGLSTYAVYSLPDLAHYLR